MVVCVGGRLSGGICRASGTHTPRCGRRLHTRAEDLTTPPYNRGRYTTTATKLILKVVTVGHTCDNERRHSARTMHHTAHAHRHNAAHGGTLRRTAATCAVCGTALHMCGPALRAYAHAVRRAVAYCYHAASHYTCTPSYRSGLPRAASTRHSGMPARPCPALPCSAR